MCFLCHLNYKITSKYHLYFSTGISMYYPVIRAMTVKLLQIKFQQMCMRETESGLTRGAANSHLSSRWPPLALLMHTGPEGLTAVALPARRCHVLRAKTSWFSVLGFFIFLRLLTICFIFTLL